MREPRNCRTLTLMCACTGAVTLTSQTAVLSLLEAVVMCLTVASKFAVGALVGGFAPFPMIVHIVIVTHQHHMTGVSSS